MSDEFRRSMIDAGLTPPDFIQSGRFYRFPGEGKRNGNTAGWCLLFEDAKGGVYGDWSTGLDVEWFEQCEYTPLEKAAYAKQREQARNKQEQEKNEAQNHAANEVKELWNAATPEIGEHKYLQDKEIQPHGIRTDGFNLIIPMYDADGKLWSIQQITPNGDKLFHKGGRVKGCYYLIGKPDGILCFAEGFSTAAAINEATGLAVAVCFNAGNIKPVAESLCEKLPETTFIFCADDDYSLNVNTGLIKAKEAAALVGGVVAIPEFDSPRQGETDFNDMYLLRGHDAVAKTIYTKVESLSIPVNNDQVEHKKSPIGWVEDFIVSKAEAESYDHPEWLYENLIINGHVIAIPAPPNGGKTTIFMYIASVLATDSFKVVYVNADVGQSDAKSMVEYADKHDFTLLLPDMKAGKSMSDIVDKLVLMNESGGDFNDTVFIFDTLKKMTDVINKSRAKELYKLLRGLSAKGMTIILLAHTNKYNDAEGRPIYEGTGDLRADVDELIYLIPEKHDDGSMTVSTEPDKTRGKFKPITFEIDAERNVYQRDDFVDVAGKLKYDKQLDEDSPIIESITEAIQEGKFRQTEIIEHCSGIAGRRAVRKALKRYSREQSQKWIEERGFQNNVMTYRLPETQVLPQNNGTSDQREKWS